MTARTLEKAIPLWIEDWNKNEDRPDDSPVNSLRFLQQYPMRYNQKKNWDLLAAAIEILNTDYEFAFPEFGPLWSFLWKPESTKTKDIAAFFQDMMRIYIFNGLTIFPFLDSIEDARDKSAWRTVFRTLSQHMEETGKLMLENMLNSPRSVDVLQKAILRTGTRATYPPLSDFWFNMFKWNDWSEEKKPTEKEARFIRLLSINSTVDDTWKLQDKFEENGMISLGELNDMERVLGLYYDIEEILQWYLLTKPVDQRSLIDFMRQILKFFDWDWEILVGNDMRQLYRFEIFRDYDWWEHLFELMTEFKDEGGSPASREALIFNMLSLDHEADREIKLLGGEWTRIMNKIESEKKKARKKMEYSLIFPKITSDNAKNNESLQKLISLHEKICSENAENIMNSDLKNIPESWKIRMFFPDYDVSSALDFRYAETFREMCGLLKAAIFCHDLQNSNFTLDEIKQVAATLYPKNAELFENALNKKDICGLIAQSMDVREEPAEKKDYRVAHCTGVDLVQQYRWEEFTSEELDEDEVIKITFDDPQYPSCYLKSSIMGNIASSPNYAIMYNWVPSGDLPMNEDGRPGQPGDKTFYRLPDDKFIDEESFNMIKNGEDTCFSVKNVERVRLGRFESDSGYVSNMHGQLPGYDVYTLERGKKKRETNFENKGKRRRFE